MLLIAFPNYKKDPVIILDAKSTAFYGGRPESGKGMRYEIKTVVHRSARKMSMDYLVVKGRMLPLMVKNSKAGIDGFSSGDTLDILATYNEQVNYNIYPINMGETSGRFEELVWLSFTLKGMQGLIEVTDMETGEMEIYE
jgi:hypothetical protein